MKSGEDRDAYNVLYQLVKSRGLMGGLKMYLYARIEGKSLRLFTKEFPNMAEQAAVRW